MGQKFNFRRALLLFKSIFITNKSIFKYTLFIVIAMILIMTIADLILSRNNGSGELVFRIAPIGFAFISLVIVSLSPTLVYFIYRDKLYVNSSNLLPASRSEKFVVPLFTIALFIPMVLCSIYIASILLFGSIAELMFSDTFINPDSQTIFNTVGFATTEVIVILIASVLAQSICGLTIMLLGKMWVLGFMGFFFGLRFIVEIGKYFYLLNSSYTPSIPSLIMIVLSLSLLFWIAAYLKFRKLQLK